MDGVPEEYFTFAMNSFDPNHSSSTIWLDSHQSSSVESPNRHRTHLDRPFGQSSFDGNSPGSDSFNVTLKFISEVLLEEEEQQQQQQQELERKSLVLQESFAQQPAGDSNNTLLAQDSIYQFSTGLGGQRGKRSNKRGLGYGVQEEEEEGRSSKHLAFYAGDYSPTEMFEKVMLWDSDTDDENYLAQALQSINNQSSKDETADLLTLLTQCARAVETHDQTASARLLSRIRQLSTPTGDSTQRLAHYFANALEARLTGAKTVSFSPIVVDDMSSADVLKAYQLHITTCPFFRMSSCYANSAIRKLATTAPKIHIIDFGILFGFQWPGLIQRLSQRPGGPPKLRITGIELPEPGFRPSEKVDETKRRLESYCQRFNVPSEYNMIARKWETVRYEDLGVRDDEIVIVNCMNRLRHVSDEITGSSEESPRDAVLKLIKRINPELFIHGVVSGTYNAPSFVARFGEAVGHFAWLFDMMEATVDRGDPHGVMFEKAVYGRYAENVVACEGSARVERPESYRQWEVRNAKAGFRQVGLDKGIVEAVKKTVGLSYHRDFSVEQDGEWLVQGWKRQRLYALSCWKPLRL